MKIKPKRESRISHEELQRVASLQAAAWNMHMEALDAFQGLLRRAEAGETVDDSEFYLDTELRMVRSRKQVNRWGVVPGGRSAHG